MNILFALLLRLLSLRSPHRHSPRYIINILFKCVEAVIKRHTFFHPFFFFWSLLLSFRRLHNGFVIEYSMHISSIAFFFFLVWWSIQKKKISYFILSHFAYNCIIFPFFWTKNVLFVSKFVFWFGLFINLCYGSRNTEGKFETKVLFYRTILKFYRFFHRLLR